MTPACFALFALLWTPVFSGWEGDDDDDDDWHGPAPPPIVGAAAFEGIDLESVGTLAVLKAKIAAQKKPAVVFVTTPGCPACQGYRNNVNTNANIKKMLNKDFITVHIESDQDAWQYEDEHGREQEDYIPRTYFFGKDGRFVNLKGPMPDHPRYFYLAEDLDRSLHLLKTIREATTPTPPPPTPPPVPKAEHFVGLQVSEAKTPLEARFQVAMQKKPAVVFVTKAGCPACGGYKSNVNGHAGLRRTLNRSFVVVHVEGHEAGVAWQYEDEAGKRESEVYVPRTYFMSTEGKFLNVKATARPENPRYFYSAGDLAQALESVLHGSSAPTPPPPPEIKGVEAFEGIELSSAIDVEDVKSEVAWEGKPAVIFVTRPGCGACRGYKKNVNESPAVQALLKRFVVVHAESGAGDQWKFGDPETENYSPRTYFMKPDGTLLDFRSGMKEHPRYFYTAGDLQDALKKTLAAASADKDEL